MPDQKQVAIITGSARGIGKATVQKFAEEDYISIAVDILEEGKELCDELKAKGLECNFFKGDVSDEAFVQEVVGKTLERYGRIDVLVNNAGIVLVKPLDEIEFLEFKRVFDVNVGGIFLFCKHVLPTMKKQKKGAIVNMASVSGHVGQIDHVVYGSTKGAILALTRALAWEVADYNIRVNSISPGSVDTPMLRGDIQIESDRTGLPFDEVKTEREAEQAFNRWADPSEIAGPIFFLASENASFITGADLLVDCGWVAK
jgi:NAD(P)-dependent dehydrogenase (short-subunit alcohol dehydrogenase family)